MSREEVNNNGKEGGNNLHEQEWRKWPILLIFHMKFWVHH